MKDGTQQGIREVRRNDRERKKAGERRTLPPLLPPPFFHSFLGQKLLLKLTWEGRNGARVLWCVCVVVGGLIGNSRQHILSK